MPECLGGRCFALTNAIAERTSGGSSATMNANELPAPPEAPPLPVGALRISITLLGDLVVPDGAARAAELQELSARAAVYATRARGEGTRRAYRSAWQGYGAWCAAPSAACR